MNFVIKILLIMVILATLGNLVGQVMLWAPPVTDSIIADGGNNQENGKPEDDENTDAEAQLPAVNVQITAIVISWGESVSLRM